MEMLKEKYPRTLEWINSLDPFIVIMGEKNVVVRFANDRPSLLLSYDKIEDYEANPGNNNFLPGTP
jgi:hypothetical protein